MAHLFALLWLLLTSRAAADAPLDAVPYASEVRQQYYAQLAKDPWRAFGAELLVPGAGNFYVGFYAPAAVTLLTSCLGAGLWIAGAMRDQPALTWTGIDTFAAARSYGLISAPIGATLLNAEFRRQLGVISQE